MNGLRHDLTQALRLLARNPGSTAVAIVALAFGIGAGTAIFSVADAVLLRPLPYPRPDRLAMVWSTAVARGLPRSTVTPPDYRAWRAESRRFADLGAYHYVDLDLTGPGQEPERLQGVRVTASLFPTLGVEPALGRGFRPEEEEEYGRHDVALISDGLWRRRFDADPNLVGRTIRVAGVPHVVVGVMPEGMPFLDDAPEIDLWLPLAFAPVDNMNTRNNYFLFVVGRLEEEATLAEAEAELAAVSRRLGEEFPEAAGFGVHLVPLQEQLVGEVRPMLLALLGAVGLVVLVACANVAGLLLARAAGREREFAVRVSLGAGRVRLVRQLLLESLPLGLAGAAGGLALAAWTRELLMALVPGDLPRFNPVAIDGRVLAVTVAAALVTVVLAGAAPAVEALRVAPGAAIGTARAVAGGRRPALRRMLVAGELALTAILLVGAGLLIKTFVSLRGLDLGYRSEGVLTAQFVLPGARYPEEAHAKAFVDELLARLAALPEVDSAGATTILPLGQGFGWGKLFDAEGTPRPASLAEVPSVLFQLGSPGYLETVGARTVEGRGFTGDDHETAPAVAIVNQALVRRYFPSGDALGRRIRLRAPDELDPPPAEGPVAPWRTIVGVVADVHNAGPGRPVEPEVFVPYAQHEGEGWTNALRLAVRTRSGDPLSAAAAVRAQVAALDPELPLDQVVPLAELRGRSLAAARFGMLLVAVFAAFALLLAALGVYGVLALLVVQRTREIGVRMALGAERRRVAGLVVGQGLRMVAAGLAVGLAAAALLVPVLGGLLAGVGSHDPLTFTAAPLVLVAVGALASYLPARRASRLDPLAALRHE